MKYLSKIASLLFSIGVKCDVKAIISKIRKLRQTYKQEKNKTKKSGRARERKWKFFDKMDGIMGHKANISPPLVLDSSTDQTEEGNMSYSEDVNMHHGNSILLYLKFILNC